MAGKKRLNLHASYAVGAKVDRDEYKSEHFAEWVKFAKELGLDGIDFNPTMFSHKNVKDGLTLSSPDETIRKFWIKHCIACLKIAEYFADEFNNPCVVNIWIPDGFKDVPADRLFPRIRLKNSLDEILSSGYNTNKVIVAVESKVFGIGVESYTVGSNEFYQNYAAKNNICCLLDNGHYHPLEYVSDADLQDKADFTALMVRQEEYKTLPFGAVWKEYLKRQGIEEGYLSAIREYETQVSKERV